MLRRLRLLEPLAAANLEAGARTPLAAVIAGLLVIPLVAMSAPALALIPHAAIAGLLLLVAWGLLDLPSWRQLLRASPAEFGVALLTLLATLSLRLELAVLIGSALSLGLFLQRTSKPALRTMGFDSHDPTRQFVVRDDTPGALPECPQLKLLRMEGSVYFGATAHVADHLQALRNQPVPQKHLLVMAKSMNFVDVSGSELWRQELHARRGIGGDLYFHRPRPPVLAQWRQDGMLELLGTDHIFPRQAPRDPCDLPAPGPRRLRHLPGARVRGMQRRRAGGAASFTPSQRQLNRGARVGRGVPRPSPARRRAGCRAPGRLTAAGRSSPWPTPARRLRRDSSPPAGRRSRQGGT